MSRYAVISIAAALTLFAALADANEPGWTDTERAERSTAVLVGTVLSVERAAEVNKREDLYRAVVRIEHVNKGEAALGREGEQIALYFEHPKDGAVSARCPDYVALKTDQHATFFVRLRKVDQEWRAFLEMGSDVREAPAKAPGA
jgi:hypothetical protein